MADGGAGVPVNAGVGAPGNQHQGDTTTPTADIPFGAGNLNEAARQLWMDLEEISGQDCYDGSVAAVGKINSDGYLILPTNFVIPNVAAADVGKPIIYRSMTTREWAQIYIMNKAACPDQIHAVKFALLRMEAVKCGWLRAEDTYKIVRRAPPSDNECVNTLNADLRSMRDVIATTKTAAFIIPMVAEHVFRTYDHHYIINDAAAYAERYLIIFRACLLPDLANFLPPALLYHSALHWVNPGRAYEVLGAQLSTPSIPDALSLRYNAAPAGTAIITTTDAVVRAMV